MKITAIGVDRKVYNHTILDRELKKTKNSSVDKQTWDVNQDTGSVTFSWYKWSLDTRGNYEFSAELSREEIVRLFVSSMSDVPLKDVVRLLAESGKKPTVRARPAKGPLPTVVGQAADTVAPAG